MNYACCKSERREATLASALNGLDYLEVLDHDAPNPADRQRVLFLHFLKPIPPLQFAPENIRIAGGERVVRIEVTDVNVLPAPDDNVARVTLDVYGDFSRYTLRIVSGLNDETPPAELDPRLASVEFSFKVQCPTDFDCATKPVCAPDVEPPQELDYLARDYPTLRRMMLDRMSVTCPDWTERNAADLGVTLVELLAYAADQISYQQDSATTEAYLDTARRRTSVRRHARLMDYHVSDGSNARTWVHLRVSADQPATPNQTRFLTKLPRQPDAIVDDDPRLYAPDTIVFEQLDSAGVLRVAHNEIEFYTWSESDCCLKQGATAATLLEAYPELRAGDVLVIEEVRGPRTGDEDDADIEKRHAVRLVEDATVTEDPVTGQAITEIRWHDDDALPFPVCVSSLSDDELLIEKVSVARGNMLLADHGRRIVDEDLSEVPDPHLHFVAESSRHCDRRPADPVPPRYQPTLARKPLTHAANYKRTGSAIGSFQWRRRDVVPWIELTGDLAGQQSGWTARRDLLPSDGNDQHFVVEVENLGDATLRFGDNSNGRRPPRGTAFTAEYRVGNGAHGNIGADALAHIAGGFADIERVRNPLPARGGEDPETIEEVRQRAPVAYRTQRRAVTKEDYARVAEQVEGIQKAAASFRWTGSWHTAFVTVDQDLGRTLADEIETGIREYIDEFRMAGHDVNINQPDFVSIELELFVCCERNYLRSDVKQVLVNVLSNRDLPSGRRGLFHPDNFTFGQPVYLSPIYAAAQAVPGVASVDVRMFRRLGDVADTQSMDDGVLKIGRLEVARLENDPNFAERGVLRIEMGGGR